MIKGLLDLRFHRVYCHIFYIFRKTCFPKLRVKQKFFSAQKASASCADGFGRKTSQVEEEWTSPLYLLLLPSLLALAGGGGGVLAGDDLVHALSKAAVGGQAARRGPQLLHAAVIRAGDGEGLRLFHLKDQRRTQMMKMVQLEVMKSKK